MSKRTLTPSKLTDEQIGKLFDQLRPTVMKTFCSREEFQKVLENITDFRPIFLKELKKFISRANGKFLVSLERVDLSVLIAKGRYDKVDPKINRENFQFSLPQEQEFEMRLIPYDEVGTDQVKGDLKKNNLRPPTLAEFLAFGAQYPDEQLGLRIIALCSAKDGTFPCIEFDEFFDDGDIRYNGRILSTVDQPDEWTINDRCVAVCK